MATREAGQQEGESGPIPLLNQYKHGLTRRRLLQTATGGLRLRRLPCHVHLVQLFLYSFPLLSGLPFIVLDLTHVWSPYYLATVYGCLIGMLTLASAIAQMCIGHHKASSVEGRSVEPRVGDGEEEDAVDDISCFSLDTFRFIFAPKKIHSVLIHPLTSGLLAFGGCFVLLPSVVGEAVPLGGVVVVCVLGWTTLCNALYSHTVSPPPEPVAYRPTDPLKLKFLMRPSYVMALAAVFIIVRLLVSEPSLYLQLLYGALCLLPLAWFLGLLPPLDALVPWGLEQVLTRVLGGSAMATDLRLLINVSLSLIATTIVAVITNRAVAVVLATAGGFLLSQDLFIHLKVLGYILAVKCSRSWCRDLFSKTYASYFLIGDFKPVVTLGNYVRVLAAGVLRGVSLLLLSLILVYFTFQLGNDAKRLGRLVFAVALVVGYLIILLNDNLQSIYILGVIRNPFYPRKCQNVEKFKRKRALLSHTSVLRRLLLGYAFPLLLVACTGLSLETRHTDIPHIWFGITATRVLRKIWQNTSAAYLELMIVQVLYLVLPKDGGWAVLGLGTHAILVGLALDIASDFFRKTQFACNLLIAFVRDSKQRSYLPVNVGIFAGSLLLFPFIVVVIFTTSVFSVPLLPLFTLPIFLPSFPRPQRFWPSLTTFGSSYSKCADTVYYRQLEHEFARALSSTVTTGRTSICPGSHLLLRFQDRLSVASVLEVGYGYATVNFRGLELQETSCHTLEATRIDNIFESVYGHESQSCHEFWFNTHLLNTLQPIDSVVIHTYSDARNVLSGIIDQPSALERFSGNLLKCIIWVFYHHLCENNLSGQLENSDPGVQCSRRATEIGNPLPQSLDTELAFSKQHPPMSPLETALSWNGSISSLDGADRPTNCNQHTSELRFLPLLGEDHGDEPMTSLPGLIPKDKPLELEHMETVVSRTTIENNTIASEVRESRISLNGTTSANLRRNRKVGAMNQGDTGTGAPGDASFKWRDLPLRYSEISKLLRAFPREWFQFVKDSAAGVGLGHEEKELDFIKLAIVCFALVDVPGSAKILSEKRAGEGRTRPLDIYRGFCGEFPYSVHLEWLKGDRTLNILILKAYRYAVRLLYDEGSLGEVESASELAEYLQDYDRNYFIGCESESGWEEAISAEKPNLFSLGRDPEKDTYTARVLSLQDEVLHVGQLNSEAVRGVWADLSLELLYLTNDDEERYSIQAHPLVLRNLTIQAADPPLGYSVHSSGIVRIPVL